MAKVLTSKFVESAKAPAQGRSEYWDAALPDFSLRITARGKKSFTLRYRIGEGYKRLSWPYPAYTLSEAREEAQKAVRAVERGDVPEERKEAPAAAPQTFGDLCTKYVEEYLKPNVRRWKAAEGEIKNHLRPALGSKRLENVDRAAVRQMIDDIAKKHPVAANRALARTRAIFNWAIERDLWAFDPTAKMKKPSKEKPVSRTLSDDELVAIWKGCDALDFPAKQYVRFLILCGQRRDDVRCMTRDEVDGTTWIIPAERYKGDRQHLVPLTDGMIELLAESDVKDGFLFSLAEGKKPYGNLVKPKRALDKASKVTDWTLHDIRRTVRTGLSKLGIRPDIAERVIGHSVGGRLGETYDLYSYREEKLQALKAWEAYMIGLLADKKEPKSVAKIEVNVSLSALRNGTEQRAIVNHA